MFEWIAHDLSEIARLLEDRSAHPRAAILGGRAIQSTPESGCRHFCREPAVTTATNGRKVRRCNWPWKRSATFCR